jgi:two-component system C4-dicarboxylate transport sensor histidine kinase DctB
MNALEATPGAGRILVLLEPAVLAGRAMVALRISDSGGGVPPDIREHIFEPFFTTKASGSGLGLSIVERLVRDHGGAVDVEPSDGGGATFSVMLPAAM